MRVKLNRIYVEIDKGIQAYIDYYLKVNDKKVDSVKPTIETIGDRGFCSPVIQDIKKYWYPIAGFMFDAFTQVYLDKNYGFAENMDENKDRILKRPSKFVYAYKCVLSNAGNSDIVVHSIGCNATLLGLSVQLATANKSLANEPYIPDFKLFLTTGDFTGNPIGYNYDYTIVLPKGEHLNIIFLIESDNSFEMVNFVSRPV